MLFLLIICRIVYSCEQQTVFLPEDVWLKIIESPLNCGEHGDVLFYQELDNVIKHKNVVQLFKVIHFLNALLCLNRVNCYLHTMINKKYPNPSLKRWSLSECLKYNLVDSLNVGKIFSYSHKWEPIKSKRAEETLFFYMNYKLVDYISSFSIREILVDHLSTVLHINDIQYSLFTDESISYVPIANAYITMIQILLERLFQQKIGQCTIKCTIPIHENVEQASLMKNKRIIKRLGVDVDYGKKDDQNNHVYIISQAGNNSFIDCLDKSSIISNCTII